MCDALSGLFEGGHYLPRAVALGYLVLALSGQPPLIARQLSCPACHCWAGGMSRVIISELHCAKTGPATAGHPRLPPTVIPAKAGIHAGPERMPKASGFPLAGIQRRYSALSDKPLRGGASRCPVCCVANPLAGMTAGDAFMPARAHCHHRLPPTVIPACPLPSSPRKRGSIAAHCMIVLKQSCIISVIKYN